MANGHLTKEQREKLRRHRERLEREQMEREERSRPVLQLPLPTPREAVRNEEESESRIIVIDLF